MPNLQIKLYHKYVCIGKNKLYIGFSTSCGFRVPKLGVLEHNPLWMLLLLLLSRFSRVRLCATPEMAAHQAPPSLGFSRQDHWSGLPFPSPMHESEKWKWSCSVMSDSSQPHGLQPTRLLCPWDFLGKSTGVGCHRRGLLSIFLKLQNNLIPFEWLGFYAQKKTFICTLLCPDFFSSCSSLFICYLEICEKSCF